MSNKFDNNNKKYLYSPGEQIYDIYRKKKGTIVKLRDDSHEKSFRASNPFHYYYHVDYEDKSFDTYVSYRDFIPVSGNDLKVSEPVGEQFFSGERFCCMFTGKTGTIRYLRDDSYEKNSRASDPNHYYYHVDFDDGSFDTYVYGKNLVHI